MKLTDFSGIPQYDFTHCGHCRKKWKAADGRRVRCFACGQYHLHICDNCGIDERASRQMGALKHNRATMEVMLDVLVKEIPSLIEETGRDILNAAKAPNELIKKHTVLSDRLAAGYREMTQAIVKSEILLRHIDDYVNANIKKMRSTQNDDPKHTDRN